ncbi:ASCC3 [Acanthosepion pharaonis]|uniref:ASCC3 n=1 Tax=Acanthosepion pharaonis TaxID=158019 RepID=A0A812E2V5_ACAPH|nr:ASCC3 [Sepia pharaonis]
MPQTFSYAVNLSVEKVMISASLIWAASDFSSLTFTSIMALAVCESLPRLTSALRAFSNVSATEVLSEGRNELCAKRMHKTEDQRKNGETWSKLVALIEAKATADKPELEKAYKELFQRAKEIVGQEASIETVESAAYFLFQVFLGVEMVGHAETIKLQKKVDTGSRPTYGCQVTIQMALPVGFERTDNKLYEEVHLPPNEKSTLSLSFKLVPISEFDEIVYIAPMKALAAEMVRNFSKRLEALGIIVRELTGDMQLTKQEIATTQVEATQSMIRIVGLSATLPNYLDVARFLRVNVSLGLFFFDGRFRPVPLGQTFIGIKTTSKMQQLQDFNTVCYEKVLDQVRKGYQVMVFVHARNETVRTAMVLREMAKNKDHIHSFAPQGKNLGIAQKAIALGTVSTVEEAVKWLSYTYLFVRMKCNPMVYGIGYNTLEANPNLYLHRKKLIFEAGRHLDKAHMIRFNEPTEGFSSTDLGRIASHFYIKYATIENGARIVRALFQIALRKGWPIMASRLLTLSKTVDKRQWEFESPLRQFQHCLSFEVVNKIEKANLTLEKMREMTYQEIGHMVRHVKMGSVIKRCVHQIPHLELDATIQPITRTVLRVRLAITADFHWDDKVVREEPQMMVFTIPIFEPLPSQYYVKVVSDRWIGSTNVFPISFQHLILPEKHPPHTTLLDLQPLPKTALKNKDLEDLYSFTHFNPVQTQIFHAVYHADCNILLGAPTGSGKTVAAELAIFRVFQNYPNAKAVYIAPLKALVRERMIDWRVRLEQKLGKKIVELTGDFTPDVKAIANADLIVTTPEKWDGVSRSWQTRSYVKQVALLVIDEIHLLGDERGPVLEVIVSRTNFISSHTEKNVRIVGLSTALANARDLADWLNITEMGLYNFRPSVRPVPLEVHVSGFPGQHYCPRMVL